MENKLWSCPQVPVTQGDREHDSQGGAVYHPPRPRGGRNAAKPGRPLGLTAAGLET